LIVDAARARKANAATSEQVDRSGGGAQEHMV